MPENILAPTEDKEAVSIPHYSLVENRRGSGDGVLMYIKDSLKYKVVDLTTDHPEHVSFEELLEKLKKNGKKAQYAHPRICPVSPAFHLEELRPHHDQSNNTTELIRSNTYSNLYVSNIMCHS